MKPSSLLQQIIDKLYRAPRSKYKTIQRFGGFLSYWKMLTQKARMVKASKNLPAITSYKDGLTIYFLTGRDYIYQTLFCAYSLTKVSKEKYQFVLVDDGSFTNNLIKHIKKQMPGVIILDSYQINQNLDLHIPADRYPFLRNKRIVYKHLRKLTDVHTIGSGYKLVLDSDMLFFKEPIDMINWLKYPSGCLFMKDCTESYGYQKKTMKFLSKNEIPNLMNVGAIGFNEKHIGWKEIDNWIYELEKKEGTSYFLEQAISAMIASKLNQFTLAENSYIVNPVGYSNGDILHHYVDLSKKYYFNHAWKLVYE